MSKQQCSTNKSYNKSGCFEHLHCDLNKQRLFHLHELYWDYWDYRESRMCWKIQATKFSCLVDIQIFSSKQIFRHCKMQSNNTKYWKHQWIIMCVHDMIKRTIMNIQEDSVVGVDGWYAPLKYVHKQCLQLPWMHASFLQQWW